MTKIVIVTTYCLLIYDYLQGKIFSISIHPVLKSRPSGRPLTDSGITSRITMSIILIILHVVVCIALIMIVLLQTGKGADMGAAFGGGSSQTLFGSTGASTFLSKATTIAAVVFMATSLALAYVSSHQTPGSVMTNVKPPVTEQASPAEPETATDKTAEPTTNASDEKKNE
ncbi:MAG: preprotein translocase subunit SecG [Thermodesulfobacteriota bacterium]|nr:preprotein translocase subunit SecG [Thermodesulfobacteriota bacterium]